MNITRSIPAAAFTAALMAVPGLGMAQGFEGAEVSASATANDSGKIDFSDYGAGVQFGIGAGISLELDFGLRSFRGISGDGRVMTLHGIYDISPGMSAGLYYGRERVDGNKATSYGIEGTMDLGTFDLAGYVGHVDRSAGNATAFGLDATMSWGNAFAFSAAVDTVSGDDDLRNLSLGGEYRFGFGPTVFANIGRLSEGDSSDNYLSIGARVELGNGTTFGNRGPMTTTMGF